MDEAEARREQIETSFAEVRALERLLIRKSLTSALHHQREQNALEDHQAEIAELTDSHLAEKKKVSDNHSRVLYVY